jgi:hypothetical protein
MLSDISYYVVLLDLCTVLQLTSEKIRKLNRGLSTTTTLTRRGGGGQWNVHGGLCVKGRSIFVHSMGWGVKTGYNLVHVVVE